MAASYKETRLDCGHIALWEHGRVPTLGEKVYCTRCDNTQQVVAIPGSFTAICNDCRWHIRRMTKDSTMENVQKHLENNFLHVVMLEDYDKTRWMVTYRTSANTRTLF